MTTATVKNPFETALKAVKPFTANTKTRPILMTALVTENHIIATDSHRLVRIAHGLDNVTPHLHRFKTDHAPLQDASNYPNVDRLFPDISYAKTNVNIDVKHWLEIHEAGLIAAKEHYKNNPIYLNGSVFSVKPVKYKPVKGKKTDFSNIKHMKGWKDVAVPEFDQINYTYSLASTTDMEMTYNCKYMIDALKLFKKFKHNQVNIAYYGPLRPFVMTAGAITVLMLPIRTVN